MATIGFEEKLWASADKSTYRVFGDLIDKEHYKMQVANRYK